MNPKKELSRLVIAYCCNGRVKDGGADFDFPFICCLLTRIPHNFFVSAVQRRSVSTGYSAGAEDSVPLRRKDSGRSTRLEQSIVVVNVPGDADSLFQTP